MVLVLDGCRRGARNKNIEMPNRAGARSPGSTFVPPPLSVEATPSRRLEEKIMDLEVLTLMSMPPPLPIFFHQFGFDYCYCAKNMCIVFKHIFIVPPRLKVY